MHEPTLYEFAIFVIGATAGAVVMWLELRDQLEDRERKGYRKGWAVATSLIRDKSRRELGLVAEEETDGSVTVGPRKPAA